MVRQLTVASAVVAVVTLMARAFDDRTLMGQSVWTKPFKFAVSIGLLGAASAWLLRRLERTRAVTVSAWVLAVTLALEQVLITTQAVRGVRSHFNEATLFDQSLYRLMGVLVTAGFVALLALALSAARQRAGDPDEGQAVLTRAVAVDGSWLVVAGSTVGFLMVALQGHAVGGPDDAAGLPLLGWHRAIGDLRPAHFVGLHGLQALIALAWALGRAGSSPLRTVRLVHATTAALGTAIVALSGQALAGLSITSPSSVAVLGAALAGGATAFALADPRRRGAAIAPLEAAYLAAALVGLVGTWTFNIAAFDMGGGYLQGWFANPAASSAATDLLVVGAVAGVFMVVEGRRLGMRHLWLYLVGTPLVALAMTFPLFLWQRERTLRARSARPLPVAPIGTEPAPGTALRQSVGLPR